MSILVDMTANELYAHAPIAMVVAEIKHPIAADLTPVELQLIKASLGDTVPIARTEDVIQISFPAPGAPTPSKLYRFVSRDLHQSVSFKNDAIVIESTDYPGWNTFRSLIERALNVRHDTSSVDGLERIGLRYLDEIRVPAADAEIDWSQWVSTELLGPHSMAANLGLPVTNRQGIAVLEGSDADTFVIRYGTGEGQAYVSSASLRRIEENTGPFFLIDGDGSWTPIGQGIPEFSVSEIIETLERIHAPMHAIFESLITERLRNEVLRDAN